MTRYAHLLGADARPVTSDGVPVVVEVRTIKNAHVSGNQIDVLHCLSGETRYLTRDGVRTLEETAGTVQWVLTGGSDPYSGQWVKAKIHDFGEQPLLRVTLRRNKQTKVIRATAEHDWLLTSGSKRDQLRRVKTTELRPGHRLPHLRTQRWIGEPDHFGIRMGFIYGDGSVSHRPYGSYANVTLWGTKRDLAKYFDEVVTGRVGNYVTKNGVEGLNYSSGMSGYSKVLPSVSFDESYLLGWLMGYFAADGSVSKTGQATISCASLDMLIAIRDFATKLGIGTYAPTSKLRQGFGAQPTMIHEMGFSATDLGDEFFLREDHRQASRAPHHERFGWTVVTVEDHGEVETVYCPRVPGTESFVLEDNIHTGNCPFCGSGDLASRSDGSVECGFCSSAFTVTVSPMYPSFPMSVNGQPYPWPGRPQDPAMMGGDPNGGGFGGSLIPGGGDGNEDPNAEGDEGGGGDGPPWADDDDDQDAEGQDDDNDTEAEVGGKKKPPFGKKSSLGYRNTFGHVIDRRAYMQHLAIMTARDHHQMAERIKTENTQRYS